MEKKTSKWLSRLIDKITQADCPNNNYFKYYGRDVSMMSGTPDYTSVTINDSGSHICFNFDFWTKELCIESYADYDQRDTIINSFKKLYRHVNIIHDAPWEEEEKFYLPLIDNEEYDQDTIRQEYNALLQRKAA